MQFSPRWYLQAKYRDSRWVFMPTRHVILETLDLDFSLFLSAFLGLTPGISYNAKCVSGTSPSISTCMESKLPFDHLDHILHCPSCAQLGIVKRHNEVNRAIASTFRAHGIHYTMEPRGLPVVNAGREQADNRKQDGPDGIFSTSTIMALELQVFHQRLYQAEVKSPVPPDSATPARSQKKVKYKDFEGIYEMSYLLFTVSSFGVIHNLTVNDLKQHVVPFSEDPSLLYHLRQNILGALIKTTGYILHVAKYKAYG